MNCCCGSGEKAIEKAVPGATLEVQNRNTNAGVKFLEETKSNNQVDLFWASAPDAFEVLKGKHLLATYKPKATGIAEKVGSYPVNDKDGFYSGFAASGYGIMWNERYVKAKKLPAPKEWQDLAQSPYFDHVSISAPSRSGTTQAAVELAQRIGVTLIGRLRNRHFFVYHGAERVRFDAVPPVLPRPPGGKEHQAADEATPRGGGA